MKRILFFLIPIVLFLSCTKNTIESAKDEFREGNYQKSIKILESLDLDEYTRLKMTASNHKEILDEAFYWSSDVEILDTLLLFQNLQHKKSYYELLKIYSRLIEIDSTNLSAMGMKAALLFRTACFSQAYELYSCMADLDNDYSSIKQDLKATIAGIILNKNFRFYSHRHLYYEHEYIDSLLVSDSILYGNIVDNYLRVTKDQNTLRSLMLNTLSMKSVINKYQLTEKDLAMMYRDLIEKNQFEAASKIASILEITDNLSFDLNKILYLYEREGYNEVQKLCQKFINEHTEASDFVKLLIKIVYFNTNYQLGSIENQMNLYYDIECLYAEVGSNKDFTLYNKPLLVKWNISMIELPRIDYNKDILLIREIFSGYIIENDDALRNINYSHKLFEPINTIIEESKLIKYILKYEYNNAYEQSQKMKNHLHFNYLLSSALFFSLERILCLLDKQNDSEFIQYEIKKTLTRISDEYEAVIKNHRYFKNNNTFLILNSLSYINNKIEISSLNEARNFFDLIEKSFIASELQYKTLNNLLEISHYYINIFKSKIFNLDQRTVDLVFNSKFYNGHISYLQKEVIYLNALFETRNNHFKDDLLFLYFQCAYPELFLKYISPKQKKENQYFTQERRNSVNEALQSFNIQECSNTQMEYYLTIKQMISNSLY